MKQITQLTAVGNDLYALGSNGEVWVLDNAYLSASTWRIIKLPPGFKATWSVEDSSLPWRICDPEDKEVRYQNAYADSCLEDVDTVRNKLTDEEREAWENA